MTIDTMNRHQLVEALVTKNAGLLCSLVESLATRTQTSTHDLSLELVRATHTASACMFRVEILNYQYNICIMYVEVSHLDSSGQASDLWR